MLPLPLTTCIPPPFSIVTCATLPYPHHHHAQHAHECPQACTTTTSESPFSECAVLPLAYDCMGVLPSPYLPAQGGHVHAITLFCLDRHPFVTPTVNIAIDTPSASHSVCFLMQLV